MGFFRSIDKLLMRVQAKILGYDPTKLLVTGKEFFPIAFASLKEASDVAGAMLRTALLITVFVFLWDIVSHQRVIGFEAIVVWIGIVTIGITSLVLCFRLVFFLVGVLLPKIRIEEPNELDLDNSALTVSQRQFLVMAGRLGKAAGFLFSLALFSIMLMLVFFLYQLGQNMFQDLVR